MTKDHSDKKVDDEDSSKNIKNDDSDAYEDEIVETSDENDSDEDTLIIVPEAKSIWSWFTKHRKKAVPAGIILILLIIFGFPDSRYKVAGIVIKKDFPIEVVDSFTGLPVSNVTVEILGKTGTTDADGKVVIKRVPVGYHQLNAYKGLYADKHQRIPVGLTAPKGSYEITIDATGRRVPVQVKNIINGEMIEGAIIDTGESKTETNDTGEAVLVLPPSAKKGEVLVSAEGYNEISTEIINSTQVVNENTIELVPAGKVYFMSTISGSLNIMKSNLDGSMPEVVVQGTGNEDRGQVQLLPTPNWRYLAYKAKRDSGVEKLYIIDTQTEAIQEVDGAENVSIEIKGWVNENLIYMVTRHNKQTWESGRVSIKSVAANSLVITVIDDNQAEGDNYYNSRYETYSIEVLNEKIIVSKTWHVVGTQNFDKQSGIYSALPGQKGLESLKTFNLELDNYGYLRGNITSKKTKPDEVIFKIQNSSEPKHYKYSSGSVSEISEYNLYDIEYPIYKLSPGGLNSLWSENRDGKNIIFVGDQYGYSENIVSQQSEYFPIAWYGDSYILVVKDSSELYIMPSNGIGSRGKMMYVTNYHQGAWFSFGDIRFTNRYH